jgi:methyltransferase, FkbM family
VNIKKQILQYRKENVFSILKGDNDYICFGAGKCFWDFIYNCCIKKDFPPPLFVCDNNEKMWGKTINIHGRDIEIVSPDMIREIDIDRTIIAMSVTLPMGILDDLVFKYRCIYHKIISLKSLETYFFWLDNRERLLRVYDCLEDERSRKYYEALFNHLLAGGFYAQDLFSANPYWNNDVISFLCDGDAIVHAGVFDGADIDRALKLNRNIEIYGFEPDKAQYELAAEKYKGFDNVRIYPFALGERSGEGKFMSDGSSSAIVKNELREAARDIESVKVIGIDDFFEDKKVNLIALDVEGVEPMVLSGGEKVIRRDGPKLAVCVYHELEHYVSLAEKIISLDAGYKLYFRHHSPVTIESVLYAIK